MRSLFGWLYITIPHLFVLYFVELWYAILEFVKFWMVLFTGRIPESIYEYQKKVMQWRVRFSAVVFNMIDGYPAIGLQGNNPDATIEFENPERVSPGLVLVRALFGTIYVGIPHGFLLTLFQLWVGILLFVSWWAILFTGRFPQKMFEDLAGYIRWNMRVSLYLGYYSDKYPPFNGRN